MSVCVHDYSRVFPGLTVASPCTLLFACSSPARWLLLVAAAPTVGVGCAGGRRSEVHRWSEFNPNAMQQARDYKQVKTRNSNWNEESWGLFSLHLRSLLLWAYWKQNDRYIAINSIFTRTLKSLGCAKISINSLHLSRLTFLISYCLMDKRPYFLRKIFKIQNIYALNNVEHPMRLIFTLQKPEDKNKTKKPRHPQHLSSDF